MHTFCCTVFVHADSHHDYYKIIIIVSILAVLNVYLDVFIYKVLHTHTHRIKKHTAFMVQRSVTELM